MSRDKPFLSSFVLLRAFYITAMEFKETKAGRDPSSTGEKIQCRQNGVSSPLALQLERNLSQNSQEILLWLLLTDSKVQRPRADNSYHNTNRRMPRRTDAISLQSLL